MEKQEILKDDNKVLIFADNREFQSDVVKELARKNCAVKPKQLEVGDFILSEKVAVERKTTSDFLSSVFDQRIFDQLKNLNKSFEKPVLLIEGTDIYSERDVHPNSIRGALSSIAIDLEIPILWSQSQDDTAAILFWIAKREQIEEERNVAIRGGKQPTTLEEKQLWLVAGLPGVDRVRAERILDHFKTPEEVFKADVSELKEVKGVGDKIAKKIRNVLTKEEK